ncbi:putative lipoate-protein ligase A [Staphylotrichum tortipilum]|uniref:Putative lipoate-protein ligase A n=1 Tax=Staphylotrichum tortipilum TaxID=2831512 RepID=A0AAN6MKU7_9PEZI|nr:putative lipoate-protein ligase A [Staphylotrichum longicolle]
MTLLTRLGTLPRRVSSTPKLNCPPSSPFSRPSRPPTIHQRRAYAPLLHHPLQIYRSSSADPYLNLSIEHHLLTRSDPDSTILFLYTNRPCVVIGRNQNPWLEVNLHALREGLPPPPDGTPQEAGGGGNTPISLVRRRSGGGTVFHDAGNTNYSVICPPRIFDRDRHALMVVRALQSLGVAAPLTHPNAVRVNERHDIVLDRPDGETANGVRTFKVSGSAYKLTRTRALHHGTCLLGSGNLGRVGGLLRGPLGGFVKARGVESVRSAICNVGGGREEFEEAVVGEFVRMYGDGAGEGVVIGEEEALRQEEVVKGVRELMDAEWIFGQTPGFVFSTHPTEEDPRERPAVEWSLPDDFHAQLTVRHGEIQSARFAGFEYRDFGVDEACEDGILSTTLAGKRLHHIKDWRRTLKQASPAAIDADNVGDWLNHMFGIRPPAPFDTTHTPAGSSVGGAVAEAVVQAISHTPVAQLLSGRDIDL